MTNSESDSIRVRLLKVLRLAQEGVGGERENAEVLLAKLLRKHSMTMTDLEGVNDQARTQVWLPAQDKDEGIILAQLVARLFGTDRKLWRRVGEPVVGLDVSAAEHAALLIAWEVYRAAFAEAREALVMAFCYKHGLFAAEGAGTSDMSAEARERATRALAMANALPVVESPARRVNSGGEN